MVADWKGANKAQGKDDVMGWFNANHHKHRMTYKTRFILYTLLERYDLLVDLFIEKFKAQLPHTIIGVGFGKRQVLFVVEDLRYEEQCERWFDAMQYHGYIPDDHVCLIYEKSQTNRPRMKSYKNVPSLI